MPTIRQTPPAYPSARSTAGPPRRARPVRFGRTQLLPPGQLVSASVSNRDALRPLAPGASRANARKLAYPDRHAACPRGQRHIAGGRARDFATLRRGHSPPPAAHGLRRSATSCPSPRIGHETEFLEPHDRQCGCAGRYPGSVFAEPFCWPMVRPAITRWPRFYSSLPPFSMATQSAKDNVPPVDKVRMGGVTASIYANVVKDSPIPMYKVTVSRTYTVKGEFKTVTSFRQEDLPYLSHVLTEAWMRIERLKQQAWDDTRAQDADGNQNQEGHAE